MVAESCQKGTKLLMAVLTRLVLLSIAGEPRPNFSYYVSASCAAAITQRSFPEAFGYPSCLDAVHMPPMEV